MSAPEEKPKKVEKKQRKPRKKVAKKIVQRKAVQNTKPYKMRVPKSIASTVSVTTPIETIMCNNALRLNLVAICSYVMEKLTVFVSFKQSDLEYADIWKAANYMIEGIWSEVQSGTITLANRPKIIHDLIAALKNKVVNARGGKVAYSWSSDQVPAQLVPFQEGPLTWWPYTPIGNEPNYADDNFTSGTNPADIESYSRILKYLDTQNHPELKTVSCDSPSPLEKDVSTRSRAYRYCGLDPCTSSGWALSVENEFPIWAPTLAKYCDYDTTSEDRRIPTQLLVNSGDACSMVGLQLSEFRPSWFNKASPRYLPVDFEEIYTFLCLWMVKAKNAALQAGGFNATSVLAGQTFNFTQQDFRIALIQALKGVFGTSYVTQFVGPLQYNQDGNMFIPATCAGNNYSNRQFATKFMVPLLLQENLNSLKGRAVSLPKSNNVAIYLPIIGRYYQDVPSEFQFNESGPVPLFASTVQESINILDGTKGNTPINLNNSYYDQVISNWNDHVLAVLPYVTKTGPMISDSGPVGLPLILLASSQTAYYGSEDWRKQKLEKAIAKGDVKPRRLSATIAPLKVLADNYVTNWKPVKVVQDKNVTYLPAASVIQLNILDTYTMIPDIAEEVATLAQNIILPTIRLSFQPSSPGDVITSQMFQVHTRFLNTVPYSQWGNPNTQNSYTRLDNMANMCITGIGHDEGGQYSRIMTLLLDKSLGAGILSTLAGIVGSIFPGAAPIASAIAGALEH